MTSDLGAPVALILGALVMGGEYGWGTLGTAFIQSPSRIEVLLGKLLALAAVLAVFVLLMFLTAIFCSYGVAWLEDGTTGVDTPSLRELIAAITSAEVILMVWAALGAFLATLLRSTSLAIGLGLVYALALEGLVVTLFTRSEFVEDIRAALISDNARTSALSFAGDDPHRVPFEPAQAALVLGFIRQRSSFWPHSS